LVVGLSSAGLVGLGLTDFRTGSAGQSIIDAGLVVGVLLDLSAAPGLVDLGLAVRFCPISGQSGVAPIGAWWLILSSGGSAQGLNDAGLMVGILLDLSAAPGLPNP
jgi:hypothetical protein